MKLYFLALGAIAWPLHVRAMDQAEKCTPKAFFSCEVKDWPLQAFVTLKRTDDMGESSIMYCVPKDAGGMPIIGYSHCFCSSRPFQAYNQAHRDAMAALFKSVLASLASRGFEKVSFTAKLCQSPQCLASFVSNMANFEVVECDGPEIIIKLHMT